MTKRVLATLLLTATLLALALVSCAPRDGTLAAKPPGALRIATLNVHYIDLRVESGAWSRGDWERRKFPLDAAFKALDAEIVAFQEMESFGGGNDDSENLAREWLLARNPGYAAAAIGDWRDFPSTQPIFYRTDRLEMVDQGWFFFSDTPDVIYSRTFDGSWPAFASWVQFRDRTSGESFHVFNVHFEYRSGSNRLKSADLVARRMAGPIAAGGPVILTGDLNARLGSHTVETLERAGLTFLPVRGATYHFDRGLGLFGAIDHVAFAGPVTPLGPPVVLRRKFDGDWPTDHYPVIADFFPEVP